MQKGIIPTRQQSNQIFTIFKISRYRSSIFYSVPIFVLAIFVVTASSFPAEIFAQSPYNSGYSHGCSDAKISDPDKRYVNQPGMGPSYHTSQFMNGYNDGYIDCHKVNPQSPSSNNVFKVIVEVTNHSFRDTYGGITISINHYPDNIFRSAYDVYFPAGETVTKTFTFNSKDVPVGTGFEVNIDHGDDYNQYKFGENSPTKKPEVIHFNIP